MKDKIEEIISFVAGASEYLKALEVKMTGYPFDVDSSVYGGGKYYVHWNQKDCSFFRQDLEQGCSRRVRELPIDERLEAISMIPEIFKSACDEVDEKLAKYKKLLETINENK